MSFRMMCFFLRYSLMSLSFIFIILSNISPIISSSEANLEDEFMERFGNCSQVQWIKALRWYDDDNRMRMNMLCNEAHGILIPQGSYFLEDVNFMENITLAFENPNYKPMWIDVIEYKSRPDERYSPMKRDEFDPLKCWHLTQGRRIDCVYYVKPTDRDREVKLIKEICGLRPW